MPSKSLVRLRRNARDSKRGDKGFAEGVNVEASAALIEKGDFRCGQILAKLGWGGDLATENPLEGLAQLRPQEEQRAHGLGVKGDGSALAVLRQFGGQLHHWALALQVVKMLPLKPVRLGAPNSCVYKKQIHGGAAGWRNGDEPLQLLKGERATMLRLRDAGPLDAVERIARQSLGADEPVKPSREDAQGIVAPLGRAAAGGAKRGKRGRADISQTLPAGETQDRAENPLVTASGVPGTALRFKIGQKCVYELGKGLSRCLPLRPWRQDALRLPLEVEPQLAKLLFGNALVRSPQGEHPDARPAVELDLARIELRPLPTARGLEDEGNHDEAEARSWATWASISAICQRVCRFVRWIGFGKVPRWISR